MDTLSLEIFIWILSYLDVFTLSRSTSVCKFWHKEIESIHAWHWRINRLEIIDLCSGMMPSMKHQVVEKVKTIRAMRRFLENPKSPASVIIWNSLVRTCLPPDLNRFFMEDTGLSSSMDVSERYIGLRRDFPTSSGHHVFYYLSMVLDEALGRLRVQGGPRFSSLPQRMLVCGNVCISGNNVFGYLLWKALFRGMRSGRFAS